jgi:hypothetical protein
VELHDKLVVLDQDCITEAWVYKAGVDVIAAVKTIITEAGESASSITDPITPKLLTHDQMWEAGTPKLTVINNMLDASGYFTLRMNNEGQYVSSDYQAPANRPPAFAFKDGENCTYLGDFETSQDIFFVPNRVIAIQEGDEESEGMRAIADNLNPDNPYSQPSVGRIIADVQTGVEATDLDALKAYAHSRLVDLSNPAATISVECAPDPVLDIYQTVTFEHADRTPHEDPADNADIAGLFVIDRIEESLTTEGLMQLTLRAVLGFQPGDNSARMGL